MIAKIRSFINEIAVSKSIRNGFIFAFFSIVNNGLNFLLLFVLAKYLLPDEYGSLSLYNNFISIIIIISTLGTTGYVSVAYFKEKLEDFKHFVTAIMYVMITVLLFVSFTFFILDSVDIIDIGLSYKFQCFGIVYCFFQFFIVLILDIWRIEEKPYNYGLLTTLLAVLNFGLTFYFLNMSIGWTSRVYGQIIVTIAMAFIALVILARRKRLISFKVPSKKYFKIVLLFGLPLVPHLMSVWLRQGLDSYIINYYYSKTEVGLYFFALNFSNLIYILGSAFNASNSIEIYKLLSKGYSEEAKRALKKQNIFISILFIIITIIVIISASLIIPILFPQYIASRIYILPLCIGGFFQIVYLMFVNILFFYSKTKYLMLTTTSFSVIYAAISLIITKYSLLSLSLLTMLINALIAITVMYFSYIELKRRYQGNQIANQL